MFATIGRNQILDLNKILREYKAGKAQTERRIIAAENWWKLRNVREESKETRLGSDGEFTSVSGWLHNVIESKHADYMDAFPEPNMLPREQADTEEARMLSAVIPCVLEQADFETTYDEAGYSKLLNGTAAYKVVWDATKYNGLGDISIEEVNLLNLFWEPGITDIQKSRYIFHAELADKDVLEEQYPIVKDKLKGNDFVMTKYLYDDSVSTENKVTVIECYYHKYVNGKKTLQYVKYVNDIVISATENMPEMAERGLYDHGLFPFVFDRMYPVKGSPCGYGYVDLCKSPQTIIDMLNTAFVDNAAEGARQRYFARNDSGVNRDQFLDVRQTLIDTDGNLGDDALRPVPYNPLSESYISILDRTINEMRETSGNTETSTGNTSSGVTAASAIQALQEASGKGSRATSKATYRAFRDITNICIELVRQFYDLPRQFRITGDAGEQEFISYSNSGIKPQYQGMDFGVDMGYRLPVFDIKVSAQKQNAYTKMAQNEMALQFFQLGFFNPQMAPQALMCLEMMDFDGRDDVLQKIQQNGTLLQKLMEYMQIVMQLSVGNPQMQQAVAQDMYMLTGQQPQMPVSTAQGQTGGGAPAQDSRGMRARESARQASQPN